MNNENLSREEAAERSALITVDSYHIHLDLTHAKDENFETYPTVTTVKFKSRKPGAQTFIDYIHHSIDSVRLNGAQLDLNKVVDGSRIMLPELAEETNLLFTGVHTIHGREKVCTAILILRMGVYIFTPNMSPPIAVVYSPTLSNPI